MKCTATRKDGKPCRYPAARLVGGLATCKYHAYQTGQLWIRVKDSLPQEVRLSAERDTMERNHGFR